jgi:hypothetical protein
MAIRKPLVNINGILFELPANDAIDHGALAGLSDDDHMQYHTDARGDVRYQPLATVLTNTTAAFTAAQESKLSGIEAGANNYIHPSVDGSLHVPATGTTSNNKVLTAGATPGGLSWKTPAVGTVTAVTGTAPVISSGGTTPAISISAATTSTAGSMSSADKTKLDGIAASAEVNVQSDWDASSGDSQILNKPITLQGYNIIPEELPNGIDLNTIITTGIYSQSQNAEAAIELHYPVVKAGLLEVFSYSTMYHQRYWVYNSDDVYIRAKYSTNDWTSWEKQANINDNVESASKLETTRTIELSGDITGSGEFDGSANLTISTTIAANSITLGTDTTGNYVTGLTQGAGIAISGTAGEGWSPTVTNSAPNVPTDISITHNATAVVVNSSDGTDGTINAATTSLAGAMASADKIKLDGIATSANNYILPAATSTIFGGIELYSDTVQSVAANAVTSAASRTYGLQLNSSGQAVVNVPWVDNNTVYTHPTYTYTTPTADVLTTLTSIPFISTLSQTNGHVTGGTMRKLVAGSNVSITPTNDGNITITSTDTNTNYYPTAFSWSNGTTSGPTGSLTGTGMSAVSFASIPLASDTAAGVVSIGDQTFAGDKTFDTIKTKETNYINSYTQSFSQSYSPASYFTPGEYQEIITITPGSNSRNYEVSAEIYIQSSNSVQIIYLNVGLRSSTLPQLLYSSSYHEALLDTASLAKPVLFIKETTTAALKIGLISLTGSVHNISVKLDVINRGSYNDAVMNTILVSDTSVMPADYTLIDITKTYSESSNASIIFNSTVSASNFLGNATTATKLATPRSINGVSFDGSASINIEDRIGIAVASAATTTVGSAGLGDYIHITGTTNITSFGTASQGGTRRTLIFDEVLTITHNATSLICVGGSNIITVVGMVIEIIAETTSSWRVVGITHPTITKDELSYLDGVTSSIQTQLNAKVNENPDITGATRTKITYDSRGLVTSGGSLVATDIPSLDTGILTSGILPVSRGGTGKQTAVIELTQGSSAEPSLSFTGDNNTGIFSPASDTVAVSAGGTEIITANITGTNFNGRLGIADSTYSTAYAISSNVTQTASSTRGGIYNASYVDNVTTLTADRNQYGIYNYAETQIQNSQAFSAIVFGSLNSARTSYSGGNSADGEGILYGSHNSAYNQSDDRVYRKILSSYGSYNYSVASGGSLQISVTTTSGSNVVTTSDTSTLAVGDIVYDCLNIPNGTTVTSITNTTTFVISTNATATGTDSDTLLILPPESACYTKYQYGAYNIIQCLGGAGSNECKGAYNRIIISSPYNKIEMAYGAYNHVECDAGEITTAIGTYNRLDRDAGIITDSYGVVNSFEGTIGTSVGFLNDTATTLDFGADSGQLITIGHWNKTAKTATPRITINVNGTVAIENVVAVGGAASTNVMLYLRKDMTGGTSAYGTYLYATVQPDVTTVAYGHRTLISTAEAAFTCSAIRHYAADQGTFGAGSTILSQYGFVADDSLIGATNNYGFYSQISAGTGRWNFYASGSAANYFAGVTTFGSTTDSSTKDTGAVVIEGGLGVEKSIYVGNSIVATSSITAGSMGCNSLVVSSGAGVNINSTIGVGQINNTTIGSTTPSTGTFTSIGALNATIGVDQTLPSMSINGSIQQVANTATTALTVTQVGDGNAFVVEDSSSTDNTPFVIDNSGRVIQGYTAAINFPDGQGTQRQTGSQILATSYERSSLGIASFVNSSNSGPSITLAQSRGTSVGTHAVVSNGDTVGVIQFAGDDGSEFIRCASIRGEIDATPADLDMPGRLVFSTCGDGNSEPIARMIINSKGAVGIWDGTIAACSLQFGNPLTGNTCPVSILGRPNVQNDATGTSTVFKSEPSILSVNSTTGLIHFSATQGSFNGSSVTDQVGFIASTSLIGATNNYGFLGDIIAGTGRYNLYMRGTAPNWFSGSVLVGGAGKIGYTIGSGGLVTQATSRTTGVTLNKTNGNIILVSAAGSTTWQSFTVTNSTVIFTDVVHVCQQSGTNLYEIHVTNVSNGSFRISFKTTGGTTTESPVFNFVVISVTYS